MLEVVGLEVSIPLLVKRHENRQDFAEAQGPRTLAVTDPLAYEMVLPLRFKDLAEVINVAKKFF